MFQSIAEFIAKKLSQTIVARGGDLRVKGCGAGFCIAGGYCADAEEYWPNQRCSPYPHSGSRDYGQTPHPRIQQKMKGKNMLELF